MVVVRRIGGFKQFVRRLWRSLRSLRWIGPDYEFDVWADPPLIYLDHWAIRRLSEDAALGRRFLAAFGHRGTVMFSLMNVLEIARDLSAQRAAQIRAFLEALGTHWVPMTIDVMKIINAEETGINPDGVNPCISVGFITDPRFARRLTNGRVLLSHVVDLTRGTDGDQLRRQSESDENRLLGHLSDWRNAYAADRRALDRQFPRLDFDPMHPMRPIYFGLARLTITDTFRLTSNHARDLFHTLASIRCAEMVTLDAHWAEQVRKLRLPADFVRVYREADLDSFLNDLEATPSTR